MTALKSKEHKKVLRYVLITAGMIAAATGVGWAFRFIDFPETNIVVVYLLSILMTARLTRGYAYGIAASVIATCAFNYFFTKPYYTLSVNDPSYLITFAIMTVTAFITSAGERRGGKRSVPTYEPVDGRHRHIRYCQDYDGYHQQHHELPRGLSVF